METDEMIDELGGEGALGYSLGFAHYLEVRGMVRVSLATLNLASSQPRMISTNIMRKLNDQE